MSDSGTPPTFTSLAEEHRLLRAGLEALEVLAGRLDGPSDDPRRIQPDDELVVDLGRFVRFLNDFGELFHHVKEEDVLLPALARAGFAWDSGPLAHVRKDHDQERYLVRVLEQAASQGEPWSREDRRHAVATARAFIEFLKEHIRSEDELLLPAVRQKLSDDQVATIDAALEGFDRDHVAGGRDAFTAEVEALVSKYRAA